MAAASIDDVSLAADLVRRAGHLAQDMRGHGIEGMPKTSAADLVTAADHAAEELVVAVLARDRPADSVVGEEGATSAGTSGRTWFIDPIDGTFNFVTGLTWWCSALALQDQGRLTLGAVYHPHDDNLWLGGRGLPTTRNSAEVPRIQDRGLDDCSIATYPRISYFSSAGVIEPFRAVAAASKAIRAGGSGSMDLAAVADGRIDLWCQHSAAEWDWLPGFALVEGAGGVTAHVTVRGFTWSLAGPPSAVADAVRLLRSA